MDADNHKMIRVFMFQFFQILKDMDAVDAAISPEIEDHHLSLKFLQGKRPWNIEPWQLRAEFERGNLFPHSGGICYFVIEHKQAGNNREDYCIYMTSAFSDKQQSYVRNVM